MSISIRWVDSVIDDGVGLAFNTALLGKYSKIDYAWGCKILHVVHNQITVVEFSVYYPIDSTWYDLRKHAHASHLVVLPVETQY